MAATPALAGPATVHRPRRRAEPPVLIRVPVVPVAPSARPARLRPPRRRLRRGRVLLAVAPPLALAVAAASGLGRGRSEPAAAAPAASAPLIQVVVAEPLPLVDPIVAPADAGHLPLAVEPAGYLIPDEEPGHMEGSAHAHPRR
jgi:hypothetical protein